MRARAVNHARATGEATLEGNIIARGRRCAHLALHRQSGLGLVEREGQLRHAANANVLEEARVESDHDFGLPPFGLHVPHRGSVVRASRDGLELDGGSLLRRRVHRAGQTEFSDTLPREWWAPDTHAPARVVGHRRKPSDL